MSGSVPSNFVAVSGQGVVTDAQLNTLVQVCPTVAQLRNFIGITSMAVTLEGQNTPGDGFGGVFIWENGNSFTDDDGVTTVVPYGYLSGAWVRLAILVTPNSMFTSITTTGTLTVGGNAAFDGSVNIAGTVEAVGAIGTSGAGSFGTTLFVGGDAAFQSGINVTGEVNATAAINGLSTLSINGAAQIGGGLAVTGAVSGTSFELGLTGPQILTGAGVPSATVPQGSVYLRTAGSVGATLYVTQGGGVWNAVAGV